MYDNYVLDPDDSTTPLSGSDQGLTITSTPRARSCIRRARNAPTAFDDAPYCQLQQTLIPRKQASYAFRRRRKLNSYGLLPERKVFMVCIAEIKDTKAESLAPIDLDDYCINDEKYLPDAPDPSMNVEGERSGLP